MSAKSVSTAASIVAIFGTIGSQAMNLSAIPSIREIHKAKSTLLYPAFPFMICILANIPGMIYPIMTRQWVSAISSVFNITINATFLCFHFYYSSIRRKLIIQFVLFLILDVFVMLIGPIIACTSSSIDCDNFADSWLGTYVAIIYSFLFCGQLITVREVIATRNSGSISPWMTGGATLASFLWTLYGGMVMDLYYLISSAFGLFGCFIQIFLLLKFPRSTSPQPPPTDKPETLGKMETRIPL
jgi:uncharacterized protein with PQ loop repeat